MRQRNHGEEYGGGYTGSGNLERCYCEEGYLMSIIWKGKEGWMHSGNGLHGGDRKTFWIGGAMAITVSI